MTWGLSPARGKAGEVGLFELRDGSLVRQDAYEARYGRGEKLPPKDSTDSRTETERDRGRLGYSSSLRRLAGVTQVVSPDLAAARRHSRESHTHKVAMVARELAELVVRRAQDDQGVAEIIRDSGGLDLAACEAAGLAHDLGHAPFGHAGEVALHDLLCEHTVDGFEGNPQSFRIVTRLDGRTLGRLDMDLTNVTLCAILKYPWYRENEAEGSASEEADAVAEDAEARQPDEAETQPSTEPDAPVGRRIVKPKKYGAYVEDRAKYDRVREKVMGPGYQTNRRQSLEASIMDLADDIAYAIHDLEDFCAAGMIDLPNVQAKLRDARAAVVEIKSDECFKESESDDPFTAATGKLRESGAGTFEDLQYDKALGSVEAMIRQVIDRASSEQPMVVVLRDELNKKIGDYFTTLKIDSELPSPDAAYVRLSKTSWHEVQVLKVITRHWLIQSPQMGMIQRAQASAIRTLFNSLVEWLGTEGTEVAGLPTPLRDALTHAGIDLNNEKLGKLDARHYRAVGDYIGSLSDSEALLRSNWFAGREIPGMTLVAEAY